MDDTISRHAAIDALSHMMDTDGFRDGWAVSRANVDCMLRSLPSAQPERPNGEWVLQSDDYHEYYECDHCGMAVGLDDVRNFCCNCGADMRGEKE